MCGREIFIETSKALRLMTEMNNAPQLRKTLNTISLAERL